MVDRQVTLRGFCSLLPHSPLFVVATTALFSARGAIVVVITYEIDTQSCEHKQNVQGSSLLFVLSITAYDVPLTPSSSTYEPCTNARTQRCLLSAERG